MRDDDAAHLRIGEKLVAAPGQRQEDLVGQVVGRDLHDLLARHRRVVLDLRNSVNQRLDGQVARLVARGLRGGGGGAGNRAARGEDRDLRKVGGHGKACGKRERGGEKRLLEVHVCLSFGLGQHPDSAVPGHVRALVGVRRTIHFAKRARTHPRGQTPTTPRENPNSTPANHLTDKEK